MSRLRARTWTQLERSVMEYSRNPNPTRLRNIVLSECLDWDHERMMSEAEHIMRTKGIDLRAAWMNAKDPSHYPPQLDPERAEEIREIRDAQHGSLSPQYALVRTVSDERYMRRYLIGFVASDSNPNIYVRREG